ncbi:MAG TPA: hypothetical protein DET40_15150 [Lentisphaeria bacterium]|nr:MAG: hypothetical protein A2X45_03745 [Lentisphaerae bacterium GWF2_50_93]HCE44876.1 hypothetical protein [Lentisphaeria bacterium]
MPQKKNIILALEGDSGTAGLAKKKLADLGITCEICAEIEPSETGTHYALKDLIGKSSHSDMILKTLATAVPELIILLLDTEGRIIYLSDCRGMKENPIGKKQHEVFPPDVAEKHMSGIRRVIETGRPVFDEEIMATPEGNVALEVKLLPLLNPEGEVYRIIGVIRDMTKLKEIEHEIRKRNLIMQALAFASEIFLTDTDLAESIMKALKKLGESSDVDRVYIMKHFKSGDKIFYKACFEWCSPGIEPQIDNPILQGLDPASTNFKRRADTLSKGDIVYGHVKDFPEKEQKHLMERGISSMAILPILEGEKLWGMLVVDSCGNERDWSLPELDVLRTAASILGAAIRRRTIEDALLQSTRRFEQVAETAREIIWEVDANGLYTYVSSLSKPILGFEPEELIGKKHFYDLHPEANRDDFKDAAFELFRKRESFHDLLNPALSKTGKIAWLSTSGVPIIDNSGNLAGYRGSDIDITNRFKADQERKILEEQLRQVQRMESIGRLAGGVAHDFNNCLQVIQGFTELMLMKSSKDSPDFPWLTEIRQSAKHATDITHQLLAFSRKQVLSPKNLNLNEIVSSQHKILKRLIGEDIRLEINTSPDLSNIFADSGNMQQVIMNLVVNSRDAMSGGMGGRITLRTSNAVFSKNDVMPGNDVREGRFVCLSVSDNGGGMTKDVMKDIFEPFFTTKGLGRGTGLGLAVVHGIIEQHQGWIHVYSEPGKGTEFKLYFPAVESDIDPSAGNKMDNVWQRGSGECVLVVEDDAPVRNIACNILRQYGYEVWEASGYKEAVSLFSTAPSKFKIVICDVVMPDGNGVELVGNLNIINPELKILLTSGYTDEKSRWQDINRKGYRFIYKPYPLGELLKVVHELLNTPKKN